MNKSEIRTVRALLDVVPTDWAKLDLWATGFPLLRFATKPVETRELAKQETPHNFPHELKIGLMHPRQAVDAGFESIISGLKIQKNVAG